MQQTPEITDTVASSSDAVRSQQPSSSPAEPDELPVEFFAEMRVHAVEPTTGARVELGYSGGGKWSTVEFDEGPGRLCQREQVAHWLMHPDTIAPDFTPKLTFMRRCVMETVQRCLVQAREIVEGVEPVPLYAVEVWPVNNQIWRVEHGERIPPGITHIRAAGFREWHEVTRLRPASQ